MFSAIKWGTEIYSTYNIPEKQYLFKIIKIVGTSQNLLTGIHRPLWAEIFFCV
jgi:hypothetical protein